MTRDTRWIPYALMALILLIAAAVRFHLLGAQSLWYDEGVAFMHSQRSLAQLIPALQDNVHVPAYFGSLALWENLVGSSEYALRAYSVLWSVLSVAATYALGKRLFSPVAGVAAAAFVALNTFSIYYAQETRMYAMLAAVGALSMWVFVGFVQRVQTWQSSPQQNRSLLYWALALGALNTVGAYTHYSYALVMLAQGVLALLWLVALWREKRPLAIIGRGMALYTGANILTLGLFAPWLVTAISQIAAQPNISEPMALEQFARILQGWFAFGITFEASMGGMAAVSAFFLIFGLLVQPNTRGRAWWCLLVPVVWVVVSVGVYTYLELYTRYLRFLLPAQIGFALWMGRGVWVLWRFRTKERNAIRYVPKVAAVVASMAFVVSLARGLPPLYHDAAYQRDDYRGLVQTIAQQSDADDAIILSAPGLQEIVGYYYDDETPVYPLPASESANSIAEDTQAIIDAHERIYTVLYGAAEQDPEGIVTQTLNQNAYPLDAQWFGDVQLLRYVTPADFDADDFQQADIAFGEAITLERFALNGRTFAPQDALQLRLEWTTSQALDTRYKVFVQLLDDSGALVAQRDSEPANGQALTTRWTPDTTITDNHALALPADAGTYTLIVGLYNVNDPSARLTVSNTDNAGETYAALATITIR